jgi:hypothetical protein
MILARGYPLPDGKTGDILCDPVRSVHVIGVPNCGKTSLLRHLIPQVPCGVIDVEETLNVPYDLLLDPERSILPLNVLKTDHPARTVEDLLACFKRAWPDGWGHRMEDLLRHCLHLAIEFDLRLTDLPRILSDQDYRDGLATRSDDERVKSYFIDHLANIPKREWRVWVESARNKMAAFALSPYIRPFFEADDCLDLRKVMDEGKTILFRLPERLMKDSASLFGMILVSRIYSAALERPEGSTPWLLVADELQRFASPSLLDLVVRGRKRSVGAIVAHQGLTQPPFDKETGYIDTLLQTVGTTVIFAVGREDAERLAKEVVPPSGLTPKRVKKKHWLFGGTTVESFYSVQEEIHNLATEIERQEQGECFIKVRTPQTVVYAANTFEAPPQIALGPPELHQDERRPPKVVSEPSKPKAPKRGRKKREEYTGDPLD